MANLDKRTLLLMAAAAALLILAIAPGALGSIMALIQSVAITVLAVVATIYLWKRL